MRSLFTVHAGEFLVGEYIARELKKEYEVWLPVRDSGVDLLLMPKRRRGKPVKLQVKFSRGFPPKFDHPDRFVSRGWFTLQPKKIMKSEADVWVFVIMTLRHEPFYVVVPIRELKRRIPQTSGRIWHLYLTVFEKGRCFQTRGLKRADVIRCGTAGLRDRQRNFSRFLNNWDVLNGR